jgi:isocitrate lyase
MCSSHKAVEKAIQNKDRIKDKSAAFKTYLAAVDGKSNNEARDVAADIVGVPIFWDCDRKS